jgi:hypothetical protein
MQISGWILSAAVDTVRACAAVGLTRLPVDPVANSGEASQDW